MTDAIPYTFRVGDAVVVRNGRPNDITEDDYRPGDAVKTASEILANQESLLRQLNDGHVTAVTDSAGVIHELGTRSPSQPRAFLSIEAGKFYESHVIAVLVHKQLPEKWYHEIDHFCGIRRCRNHARWAAAPDNISRELCLTLERGRVCDHNPPCITTLSKKTANLAVQEASSSNTRQRRTKCDEILAFFD